jgi:hypothetical protein
MLIFWFHWEHAHVSWAQNSSEQPWSQQISNFFATFTKEDFCVIWYKWIFEMRRNFFDVIWHWRYWNKKCNLFGTRLIIIGIKRTIQIKSYKIVTAQDSLPLSHARGTQFLGDKNYQPCVVNRSKRAVWPGAWRWLNQINGVSVRVLLCARGGRERMRAMIFADRRERVCEIKWYA